jgi:hypothetical protein
VGPRAVLDAVVKTKIPRIIIRVIQLRRMRWAGNIVRMGEMRNAYTTFFSENLTGRDYSRDKGVDE